ncbi:cytochrome d ubiquinol oxidase subunit II [Pseudonocardia sp. Cha107L01]|uniref:cytochrome d ubiquinol oxidase subunit II n=1 Tax=Pseudonocardia sp. Cha107L01 TaxID=3457576 RepID=UPI00403E6A4A
MLLQTLPLLISWVGLVLYTMLAGADFGAGFWQLTAGGGEHGRRLRDHAHHAMAPVWEANHVWLVLVLTVMWTAYPTVFGSVCSTLAIPIFLAAIGIVLRGLCYAVQSATDEPAERRFIDTAFALSSILTPFMLGTVIGGIATGRVPVGNAKGDMVTSWVNPTSLVSGCLAVAVGAYLAAVFLAADARRHPVSGLERAFRSRALLAGVAAGVLALVALPVLAGDAPRILAGLSSGWGLAAAVVSAVGGFGSLALVWRRHFDVARVAAGVAVAALLGGWAAAQRPYLLPGLTLGDAAADSATLWAVVISVLLGLVVLAPSLALLFRLSLAGHLDPDPGAPVRHATLGPDAVRPRWAGRVGVACFLVGLVLLTLADAGVAHVFGVLALAGAGLAIFTAVGPDEVAAEEPTVFVRGRR